MRNSSLKFEGSYRGLERAGCAVGWAAEASGHQDGFAQEGKSAAIYRVTTDCSSEFLIQAQAQPTSLNSREQVSSQFPVTPTQTLSGALNVLYMLVHIYLCVYSSSWQLHGLQVSKSVVMLGEWDKTASVSSRRENKIPISHL